MLHASSTTMTIRTLSSTTTTTTATKASTTSTRPLWVMCVIGEETERTVCRSTGYLRTLRHADAQGGTFGWEQFITATHPNPFVASSNLNMWGCFFIHQLMLIWSNCHVLYMFHLPPIQRGRWRFIGILDTRNVAILVVTGILGGEVTQCTSFYELFMLLGCVHWFPTVGDSDEAAARHGSLRTESAWHDLAVPLPTMFWGPRPFPRNLPFSLINLEICWFAANLEMLQHSKQFQNL